MEQHRISAFIRWAIMIVLPRGSAALEHHVAKLSKLSMEEIEELTQSDEGMRQLSGSFYDLPVRKVRSPKFSELVAAVPGPMTDEEYAKVLSGGTRHEWGPWRRLGLRLMARNPRKKRATT